MEDKQVSEESAWNDGEVDGENRTDQNPRPLRDKHVDADSPFSRIGRHTHPREKAEGCDQDARPRLNELILHDFDNWLTVALLNI